MAPDRFQEQFDRIQAAMGATPLAAGPGGAPRFLYEKGYVIARDGEAEEVAEVIRERFRRDRGTDRGVEREGGGSGGVSRIRVGDPADGDKWSDPNVTDALEAVQDLERDRRRRMVSRNHVVSIAVNCCPGDEPVPVPPTCPPNPLPVEAGDHQPAGSRVSVLVIDTGLVTGHDTHPLLAKVHGGRGPSPMSTTNLDEPAEDSDGILRQYVGHGTFIAGIVRAMAPHTDVTVRNTLRDAGAVLESVLGQRLLDAVNDTVEYSGRWPDIINLSAGTPNSCAETLLGLEEFMRRLRNEHTLLVAAAGNNGSEERFWPAAYGSVPGYEESVVSVGALREDGTSGACFSNHGTWVDVYAPGERLISTFTARDGSPAIYEYQHSTYDHCRYHFTYGCTCQFPPHVGELTEGVQASKVVDGRVMFDGLAKWSGTSFAAPVVVGMVAEYMTRHGVDPRTAARLLLEETRKDRDGHAEFRGRDVLALRPSNWHASTVRDDPADS